MRVRVALLNLSARKDIHGLHRRHASCHWCGLAARHGHFPMRIQRHYIEFVFSRQEKVRMAISTVWRRRVQSMYTCLFTRCLLNETLFKIDSNRLREEYPDLGLQLSRCRRLLPRISERTSRQIAWCSGDRVIRRAPIETQIGGFTLWVYRLYLRTFIFLHHCVLYNFGVATS